MRLLNQSTRARCNGGRDILGEGTVLVPCACWELSFEKVRRRSRGRMRRFAYLMFVNLMGSEDPPWFCIPCAFV